MAEHLVTEPIERRPTHPGQVLRKQVLPALGIDVKQAAKLLGISRNTLHGLIREKAPNRVTAAMALRIAKLCGNSPEMWLNMQRAYDLWEARQDAEVQKALKAIPTLAA